MLSSSDTKVLQSIANRLQVPLKRLYALIAFESNFNPLAVNPSSKAAGLIQFMPDTAKSLNYADQFDLIKKNPTIKSQLEGPVLKYLSKYKPFPTDQSLFMAVFYPKARTWPMFKTFPDYVRKANPGINNPADYISKVYLHSKLTTFTPLIILLIVGSAIYYHITKKKRGEHGQKKTEQSSSKIEK